MTVTLTSITEVAPQQWFVQWESDLGGTPVFYIYRDGEFLYETVATEGTFMSDDGGAFVLDVFDDAGETPEYVNAGRVWLCWYGVDDASQYTVHEYVDGAWVARDTVIDGGQGYFSWQSRVLEDVTEHRFRVTATDAIGNEGAQDDFWAIMVRHPDVPDVDFAYDSGTGAVTVSEA